MFRLLAILLSALVSSTAAAQSLDDRVRELERRVEQLEKQGSTRSAAVEPSRTPGRSGWRSLQRGMTQADVRSIVGEPDSVDVFPSFSFWSYRNGGKIQFGRESRVEGWSEPLR